MKNILLRCGYSWKVYSVPAKIADNLEDAFWYFSSIWIFEEPQCERHIRNGVAWYNGDDFIDYLNNWEMPEYKSVLIEELNGDEIPEQYRDCPRHHF